MQLRRVFSVLSWALLAAGVAAQEIEIPRDSVPEDHLTWFGLKGAVKAVKEYNYGYYGKTIWRFDPQGRLVEYTDYMNPFAGSGGCVFGLYEHFRYAYDKEGKIIFLETFNADNNVVDAYDDMILELFPPQNQDADLFLYAMKEYGDTTYCWSRWSETEDLMHYQARRFDKRGNWIEDVSASEDDYDHADVTVRDITYYRDIEVMGLPEGVKSVTHKWKADGKNWSNQYDFDREGMLQRFRSWCEKEQVFEWKDGEEGVLGSDLIVWEKEQTKGRKVVYWK